MTQTDAGTEAGDRGLPVFPAPRDLSLPFDPSPALGDLAKQGPVHRVWTWSGEAWLITSHDEARAALADRRLSSDVSIQGYPHPLPAFGLTRASYPSFIVMDEPAHGIQRRMVNSAFSAKEIRRLEPFMRDVARDLVQAMKSKGMSAELVEEYCLPLPVAIISRILGVPTSDYAHFSSMVQILTSADSTLEQAQEALAELCDVYLRGLIRIKTSTPGDDLTSRLVHERLLRGELTEDALIGILRVALTGGHDTSANMLALGILALLEHPDQLAHLRSDWTKIRQAVDELLRYVNVPHRGRRRVAVEEVTVHGRVIEPGDGVIVSTSMADRDPAIFEDADTLDLSRDTSKSLAFGTGPHQCLGQNLARLELQVGYQTLFEAFPDLRLQGTADDLHFTEETLIYGLSALPVTW